MTLCGPCAFAVKKVFIYTTCMRSHTGAWERVDTEALNKRSMEEVGHFFPYPFFDALLSQSSSPAAITPITISGRR